MSKIQAIKNFTAFCFLDNYDGKWFQNISGLPTPYPDEMIVRQITYNANFFGAFNKIYFIWCSVVGDYIGQFTPLSSFNRDIEPSTTEYTAYFVSNPQTRFKLNQAVQGQIEFQVHQIDDKGNMVIDESASGEIGIALEFVKYISK